MASRRRSRVLSRGKRKEAREYDGKKESSTGPQQYKDSPQYELLERARGNRENPLHKMVTVQEGPGYDITTFLNPDDLLNLQQTTTKTDDALSDTLGEEVEEGVLFKRFWEKEKLDEYYYSVPMRVVDVVNDQAGMVLYKILKSDVDAGSYDERARMSQDGGARFRQIGCLNWIKFGGRLFRIYDFPYTAPGLEDPVEFKLKNGAEDLKWKNTIRQRYRSEDTEWDQSLEAWEQQMREEADAKYKEIMDGKDDKKPIELRYIPYFHPNNEVTKEQFKNIYEDEILSDNYLDQQKRWVEGVFLGGMMPGNTVKIVELKSFTKKVEEAVNEMLKSTYECCSIACEKLIEGVQGCSIQGGKRKRTRRRRKKNRKKRTKKKARRRRRKSSKRRRRRKR